MAETTGTRLTSYSCKIGGENENIPDSAYGRMGEIPARGDPRLTSTGRGWSKEEGQHPEKPEGTRSPAWS